MPLVLRRNLYLVVWIVRAYNPRAMYAPNNRNSHLSDKPLNRCEILRECHLANEEFCQELEVILKRLFVAGFLSCSAGMLMGLGMDAERKQVGEEALQEGVRVTEESLKLLRELIKKWPHAVWLFFPSDGYAGLLRLMRPFYTQFYPPVLPDDKSKVLLQLSYRVTGNRWCGEPKRLRLAETTRALNMWKEFKAGLSPIEIARREMTHRRGPRKSLHSALVMVSRYLQRTHVLIYGTGLPADRRRRRITGFDPVQHWSSCIECNQAKTDREMCKESQDYINQDVR